MRHYPCLATENFHCMLHQFCILSQSQVQATSLSVEGICEWLSSSLVPNGQILCLPPVWWSSAKRLTAVRMQLAGCGEGGLTCHPRSGSSHPSQPTGVGRLCLRVHTYANAHIGWHAWVFSSSGRHEPLCRLCRLSILKTLESGSGPVLNRLLSA